MRTVVWGGSVFLRVSVPCCKTFTLAMSQIANSNGLVLHEQFEEEDDEDDEDDEGIEETPPCS